MQLLRTVPFAVQQRSLKEEPLKTLDDSRMETLLALRAGAGSTMSRDIQMPSPDPFPARRPPRLVPVVLPWVPVVLPWIPVVLPWVQPQQEQEPPCLFDAFLRSLPPFRVGKAARLGTRLPCPKCTFRCVSG